MRKLVSVVIPIYNAERFLGNCIDSILKQTYQNLEIILVNDGSTDDSLKIIRNYEKIDKRIKVVTGNNSGVSSARNKGIKVATGEKIIFFDADDIMEHNTIEYMMRESGADLVIGNFDEIDEYGKYITENILYKTDKWYDASEPEKLFFLMDTIPFPGNKMYSLKLIKDNDIIWPNTPLGEDQGFYLSYLSICREVRVISKKIFRYRVVSDSASHKVNVKSMLKINIGFDYACEFAKLHGASKYFFENLHNRRISNYYIQFLKYIYIQDNKERKDFFFHLYDMILNEAIQGKVYLNKYSEMCVKVVQKKYKYRMIYLSKLFIFYAKRKYKDSNKLF